MTELVNAARVAAGCQPVAADSGLMSFAQAHSDVQAAEQTVRHSSGPPGWSSWAENVAAGNRSAAEVHADWMSSDGHRENILNCGYTSIGVAVSRGADGTTYWTQVFGG